MANENKQNGSAISRAIIVLGLMASIVTLVIAFRDEIKVRLDPDSAAATVRDLNALEDNITARVLVAIAPEDGSAVSPDRQASKDKAARDTADQAPDAARLIAEGKLDEGFAMLEASARARLSDAAQEWRDLGALAYDRDPQRALEAYREAARLDASDFWSLIYLSRLENTHSGNIVAAKAAAETALHVADDARERSVALNTLGDVAIKENDLAAAQGYFTESLEIAHALAAASPQSAEAKRDVSVSLNKLGDLAIKGNDLAAARGYFSESLETRRALAAASPESAEAKRDVSVSLNRLGDLAIKENDLAAARGYFTESLETRRALAAAGPQSAEAKRDVSVSLNKLGDLAITGNDLAAAQGYFTESLETDRALAAASPQSAEAKRDVSVSLERLGDVAIKENDLTAARGYYTTSLETRRALAAASPESAEAKRDVIVSLDKLGDATGEVQYWQEALSIAEEMEAKGQLAPADALIPDYLRQKIAAAGK